MSDPEHTSPQTPAAILLSRDTVDSLMAALQACHAIPHEVSRRLDEHADAVHRRTCRRLTELSEPLSAQLAEILRAVEHGFDGGTRRADATDARVERTEARLDEHEDRIGRNETDFAALRDEFRDFVARYAPTSRPPPPSMLPDE